MFRYHPYQSYLIQTLTGFLFSSSIDDLSYRAKTFVQGSHFLLHRVSTLVHGSLLFHCAYYLILILSLPFLHLYTHRTRPPSPLHLNQPLTTHRTHNYTASTPSSSIYPSIYPSIHMHDTSQSTPRTLPLHVHHLPTMTKWKTRVAIRNVRHWQEEFDKTERPDYRLRRDLVDARAFFEAVKAKDKSKRKTNRAERIRAQLVEAEEEANRAFGVATETSRAAGKTKKAANASRQGTYILK